VIDNSRSNVFDLGSYTRVAGVEDVINDDSSLNTLAVVKSLETEIPGFFFEYTIVRSGDVRTGKMTVVTGQTGTAGTGFSWVDDFVENGSTAVTLEAVHNGSIVAPEISITYTANGSGNGTIRYSISHLY